MAEGSGPAEATDDGLSGMTPQAIFENAVSLHQAGDGVAALAVYRRLLDAYPGHADVLNMCAIATFDTGDYETAVQLFEKTVAAQPDHVQAWNNLGNLYAHLERLEDAAAAFTRVVELASSAAFGYFNLGNALQRLERFEDALEAYQKGLEIEPDLPQLVANYGRTLLWCGDWVAALGAFEHCLTVKPGHTGALAQKSVALQELRRDDELVELVDLERFVRLGRIQVPDPYADLTDFNRALVEHCLNHPTLTYEPPDNTTEKGYQTGNLVEQVELGPIAHLIELINQGAKDYCAALPLAPGHLFLGQRPDKWRFDIWGTVLGAQGHQSAHIHRDAWLSGCYYAQIPDVVRAKGEGHDGWIEFGRPQLYPQSKAESKVRLCQPEEGLIILFPSYIYHRTIPFEAEVERVSIAFDLIPES